MKSNNSFKPNLLRYINNMAEKACHVVGSATQVGLTQAIDGTAFHDEIQVLAKYTFLIARNKSESK